jgi:hypothetical protein
MKIKLQEINSRQDAILYQEYTEYMKTGATNIQALVQVAITNELEAAKVFDALARAEHRNLQGAAGGDY